MAGAYRFIKENNVGAGKRVAVLFADSSRNYMSKFMDDDWMKSQGFDEEHFVQTTKEQGSYCGLVGFCSGVLCRSSTRMLAHACGTSTRDADAREPNEEDRPAMSSFLDVPESLWLSVFGDIRNSRIS